MNKSTYQTPPVVWTIAGTDPTAAAGVQADLKTFQGMGVYGCTAITAVLAQNATGVQRVEYPTSLPDQIRCLSADYPPAAIKVGMLGTRQNVACVAEACAKWNVPVICDPVLRSSSGSDLMERDAFDVFLKQVLPHVTLLTPNLPEAERLTGLRLVSPNDVEKAATALLAMGCRSVLIKGGHSRGSMAQDYWSDGNQSFWLSTPRVTTDHARGTGCTLSSAITAALALGYDVPDALVIARAYVHQGLRCAPGLGGTHGPLHHGGWPMCSDDLPWITDTAEEGTQTWSFPECDARGVYPVVDDLEWVGRLFLMGVSLVQLRIKKTLTPRIEEDIAEAVLLARRYDGRLIVNDHWEAAIRHGAYGVHLGQDDLSPEALSSIQAAGLRLGLSTHTYAEVARAWAYGPSYIAIGTVFPSPSKEVTYNPLGVPCFERLRAMTPCPVVAIGGITVERAPALLEAGADGIAVISDITKAADVEARVAQWKALFS